MPDLTTTRRARLAALGLLLLTLVVGGANLVATYQQVHASQHKWCAILVTLDEADQHAPPPTSAFGRRLVADFHNLRGQYGCG